MITSRYIDKGRPSWEKGMVNTALPFTLTVWEHNRYMAISPDGFCFEIPRTEWLYWMGEAHRGFVLANLSVANDGSYHLSRNLPSRPPTGEAGDVILTHDGVMAVDIGERSVIDFLNREVLVKRTFAQEDYQTIIQMTGYDRIGRVEDLPDMPDTMAKGIIGNTYPAVKGEVVDWWLEYCDRPFNGGLYIPISATSIMSCRYQDGRASDCLTGNGPHEYCPLGLKILLSSGEIWDHDVSLTGWFG